MGLIGLEVHNGGLIEASHTDFSVSTELSDVFMNIRNVCGVLVELLSFKSTKLLAVDTGADWQQRSQRGELP